MGPDGQIGEPGEQGNPAVSGAQGPAGIPGVDGQKGRVVCVRVFLKLHILTQYTYIGSARYQGANRRSSELIAPVYILSTPRGYL